MLFIARPR